MPVLSVRHGAGALLLALLGFAAAVQVLDAAGVLTLLRRISDGGLLSLWRVWFLCASAVLLLIVCTALLAGAGH